MSDLRCPQCLLSSCVDCAEKGCPGVGGFVTVAELLKRPDRKMMETLGARIEVLEGLVLRAGDYFHGCESGEMEVVQDVMIEAERIRGKQKKEGAA